MQRMKLHTSGVKIERLGSLQDRIFRSYLIKEAELEAKRSEFIMLTTLTNPSIQEDNKRTDWANAIKKTWTQYLSRLFHVEVETVVENPEEEQLKKYYDMVVSKLKPVISKDRKSGKLSVSGLDKIRF